MKIKPLLTIAIALLGWPAWGMPPMAALSMLESSDNNAKIGTHGEITKFQMLPKVWRQYRHPGDSRLDPKAAYQAALKCWHDRVDDFVVVFHRQPTAGELYRLWNSPTALMEGQPPTPAVAERVARFENLIKLNDIVHDQRSSAYPAPGLGIANPVSCSPSIHGTACTPSARG